MQDARYIIGIILGIIGSSIIVLNENKTANSKNDNKDSNFSNVLFGVFLFFVK